MDKQTALEVVRHKRAKQLQPEKTSKNPSKVGQQKYESGEGLDTSPQKLSQPLLPPLPPVPHTHPTHCHPSIPVHVLSPDSSVPPPPSPPCTCGKVLGDMGPPPPASDPWDSQSIDSHLTGESKGTLESRRSQGYISMTSASTYLIDATGADPVILPGDGYHYRGPGQPGPSYQGQQGPPYQGQPGPPYQGPPGPHYQGPPGPPYHVYKEVEDTDGLYHPHPAPPQLNGRSGHCNHMDDGCECFRENYSINRKVRELFVFFTKLLIFIVVIK